MQVSGPTELYWFSDFYAPASWSRDALSEKNGLSDAFAMVEPGRRCIKTGKPTPLDDSSLTGQKLVFAARREKGTTCISKSRAHLVKTRNTSLPRTSLSQLPRTSQRLHSDVMYRSGCDMNGVDEEELYLSSAHAGALSLGTIERDASGLNGRFAEEPVRGHKAVEKLLSSEPFETVLDVGAGDMKHSKLFIDAGKTVDTVDFGRSTYFHRSETHLNVRQSYLGDFNLIEFKEKYDLVWCSHVLEHQPNPNLFLKKVCQVVKEGGLVAIIVPPRKPFMTDGHVSLWNAGLVLYHLVLAGIDCSAHTWICQYDYNICVVVRAHLIKHRAWPKDLCMDTGDIQKLSKFFPRGLNFRKGLSGDIFHFPRRPLKLKIAILIPARYNSSRFPGKALHLLDGVPLVLRVLKNCLQSGFDTFILSDDERILSLSPSSIKTSVSCRNGTERCAEAAVALKSYDAFINVQGHMPDVTPALISAVASKLNSHSLATAYTRLEESERQSSNIVKLIHNEEFAIWSSRSPLTYGDRQIGIYGYHTSTLRKYPTLSISKEELGESLEQLRWYFSGHRMSVVQVAFSGIEIIHPQMPTNGTWSRMMKRITIFSRLSLWTLSENYGSIDSLGSESTCVSLNTDGSYGGSLCLDICSPASPISGLGLSGRMLPRATRPSLALAHSRAGQAVS